MKTIAEYKAEDILKHLHGGVLEKVFWNIQGQIDNAKEFLETEKNLDEELKQLTEKTIEEQEKIALNKVNLLRAYKEELEEKLKHAEKELIESEQKFFEKNCIFVGSVKNLKDALLEEVDKKLKQ
jgi:GTPase involved in cell partitioning and DNA repair